MTDGQNAVELMKRAAREHRAVLVPLAVVLAINVVVALVVIAPLARRVATVEERNQRAAEALASARATYGQASGMLTGRDRAVTELRTFYTDVLPRDLDGARRLTHLRVAKLAEDANVRYTRGTYEPVTARESRLTRLKAEIELSGSYASVRAFVHRLETAPEFVVIDNVQLSEGTTTEGQLAVTMALSTYYRSQQP